MTKMIKKKKKDEIIFKRKREICIKCKKYFYDEDYLPELWRRKICDKCLGKSKFDKRRGL